MRYIKYILYSWVPILLTLDSFIAGVPQIVRILHTKSSNDVSIFTWVFSGITCIIWSIQAFKSKNVSLLLGGLSWLLMDIIISILAIYYRH